MSAQECLLRPKKIRGNIEWEDSEIEESEEPLGAKENILKNHIVIYIDIDQYKKTYRDKKKCHIAQAYM